MPPTGQATSVDSFIDWENAQPDRNEFDRQTIRPLGAEPRINGIVVGNVATSLKLQLRGSRCSVFALTMKLQVGDDGLFYPDVFVTCDPADLATDIIFRAPTVIVEVLSESTQAFDRGVKFSCYRRIASLREYLLIDPDTRSVELFRRGEDGLFTLHDYTGVDRFPLTSIGCELLQDEVFEGV